MAQSPIEFGTTEDGTTEDGGTDSALDRYRASWARLNASMRRGVSWSGGERNAAFVRTASGTLDLVDAAPVIGLDFPDDGRGAARIDIDFDGDEDLVVTNRTGPRVRVLSNRWADGAPTIALRLVGTHSNTEAAGAVAFATPIAAGEAPPEELFRSGRTQRRTRAIGSGFLAQSSAWLRFAFPRPAPGGARWPSGEPRVHLRVRWTGPNGGVVEDFGVVAANRRHVLVEGSGTAREVPQPPPIVHAPGELVPEPETDQRRRLILPAPAPVPSVFVRTQGGRTARLFGITPDGPRGVGRPVVLVAWNSADPAALEDLGDLAALCQEAKAVDAEVVALDLAAPAAEGPAGGDPDPLQVGAALLASAGWTGDILGATRDSGTLLRELAGWRFDRTDPPAAPWSFVFDPDGRLAILRSGPWAKGDFALDVKVLRLPAERRPLVTTLYPGLWVNPPDETDQGRFRERLAELGLDDAVRELDLARVSMVSIVGADVQIRLGQALLARGDLDGALERFDAALEREPQSILGHRARAYTLHLLERYDEALRSWTEALRLEPLDIATRGNRALAAVAAGQLDLARADLERLEQRTSHTASIVVAVRDALELVDSQAEDER